MSAMTSEAWSRLMAAPWGKFDRDSIEEKERALLEYALDWTASEYNPANAGRKRPSNPLSAE